MKKDKIYFNPSLLYKLSCFGTTPRVLCKLLEYMDHKTNKIFMNSDRRNEVINDCNISRSSYDRAIKELLSVNLLVQDGVSFIVNSNIIRKGKC